MDDSDEDLKAMLGFSGFGGNKSTTVTKTVVTPLEEAKKRRTDGGNTEKTGGEQVVQLGGVVRSDASKPESVSKSKSGTQQGCYGNSDSEESEEEELHSASVDVGGEQSSEQDISVADKKANVVASDVTTTTKVLQKDAVATAAATATTSFKADWDDSDSDSDASDDAKQNARPATTVKSTVNTITAAKLWTLSPCHTVPSVFTTSISCISATSQSIFVGGKDGSACHFSFTSQTEPLFSREIQEGYPVLQLLPSPCSKFQQAVTASNTAFVLDPFLKPISQCKAGYQYVNDVKQLKGHKAGLLGGYWHPTRAEFVTCGTDGCAKLWRVEGCAEGCFATVKPRFDKSRRGGEYTQAQEQVTSCAYNADGSQLALACDDKVEVYKSHEGASFVNTEIVIDTGFWASQVLFHKVGDQQLLLVRGKGHDGQLLVYDVKKRAVVFSCAGQPNEKDGMVFCIERLAFITCSVLGGVDRRENSNIDTLKDEDNAKREQEQRQAALALMGVTQEQTQTTHIKREQDTTEALQDSISDGISGATNAVFSTEHVVEHANIKRQTRGEGSIAVLDLLTLEIVDVLQAEEPVTCVSVTKHRDVVAGTASGQISVWTSPQSGLRHAIAMAAKSDDTRPKKTAANVYIDLSSAAADPTGRLTLHGVKPIPKKGQHIFGASRSAPTIGNVNNTSIQHQYLKKMLPDQRK